MKKSIMLLFTPWILFFTAWFHANIVRADSIQSEQIELLPTAVEQYTDGKDSGFVVTYNINATLWKRGRVPDLIQFEQNPFPGWRIYRAWLWLNRKIVNLLRETLIGRLLLPQDQPVIVLPPLVSPQTVELKFYIRPEGKDVILTSTPATRHFRVRIRGVYINSLPYRDREFYFRYSAPYYFRNKEGKSVIISWEKDKNGKLIIILERDTSASIINQIRQFAGQYHIDIDIRK